jgi:hypothetical protein
MKKLLFGALAAIVLFSACKKETEISIDLNKATVLEFNILGNMDSGEAGSEVINLTTNKELADNLDKLKSFDVESFILTTEILSGGNGNDCSLNFKGSIVIDGTSSVFGFYELIPLSQLVAEPVDLNLDEKVSQKILSALKSNQTITMYFTRFGSNSGGAYDVKMTPSLRGKAVADC